MPKRAVPRNMALAPRGNRKGRWLRKKTLPLRKDKLPEGVTIKELLEMHGKHGMSINDMSINEIAEFLGVKKGVIEKSLPIEVTNKGGMEIAKKIIEENPGKYTYKEIVRMTRTNKSNLTRMLRGRPDLKKKLRIEKEYKHKESKTIDEALVDNLRELGVEPPQNLHSETSIRLLLNALNQMELGRLSGRQESARNFVITVCKVRLDRIRSKRGPKGNPPRLLQ